MKPYLSCGELRLRSSCQFRYVRCRKCGNVGHILDVCECSKSFITKILNSYMSKSTELDRRMGSPSPSKVRSSTSLLMQKLMTNKRKSHLLIINTGNIESIIYKGNFVYLQ